MAVHEVASNGLRHGEPPVTVRVWLGPGRVVCTVTDRGHGFDDPFTGYLMAHFTGDDTAQQERVEQELGDAGGAVRTALSVEPRDGRVQRAAGLNVKRVARARDASLAGITAHDAASADLVAVDVVVVAAVGEQLPRLASWAGHADRGSAGRHPAAGSAG